MTESENTKPATGFLPPRWLIRAAWKGHKGLFRLSGGRFGLRAAKPDTEGLALLTTTGRRSGQSRSVMIAFYEDGDDLVTMAMNGWDAAEPAWWLNLQAEPNARLTTSNGDIAVVGRAATIGEEHDRLWERWRALDGFVDRHAARRTNGTAVVILRPIGD